MLADHEIINANTAGLSVGRGLVVPFDYSLLQPNSIDVRLSDEFLVPRGHYNLNDRQDRIRHIDTADVEEGHMESVRTDKYILMPGEFILGSTEERFSIPSTLVGRVEGKSSLGRLGLMVHVTAGFVDAGFSGQVTLEIVNVAPWGITLHAGMTIAQMAFSRCTPVGRPYQGRYQGQSGPQESRYAGAKREGA